MLLWSGHPEVRLGLTVSEHGEEQAGVAGVLEVRAPGSREHLHEDRLGHPADTPSVRG
jgi:hypothetical protein